MAAHRMVLKPIRREFHGQSGTSLHRIWGLVKNRCHNPNSPSFPSYGGRGIVMCDRWYYSFETFVADMGPRPGVDYQLDRINNDGGYSPENCRWSTRSQQARNRRDTHLVTYNGHSATLAEWSEITGIKRSTLSMRFYKYGWSVERLLTTPTKGCE